LLQGACRDPRHHPSPVPTHRDTLSPRRGLQSSSSPGGQESPAVTIVADRRSPSPRFAATTHRLLTRQRAKERDRAPALQMSGGGGSPLSFAAIRGGDTQAADESASERAGSSSRTPNVELRRIAAFLRGGGPQAADESASEGAGASSRTPNVELREAGFDARHSAFVSCTPPGGYACRGMRHPLGSGSPRL
jgi:hypothetical protein